MTLKEDADGYAIAASTGVAAGTAYLLGGSYEDMAHAMQSVIGTLFGMITADRLVPQMISWS